MNWIAAAASPPLGLGVALIAWLVTAKKTCGALNVECTGKSLVTLVDSILLLLTTLVRIKLPHVGGQCRSSSVAVYFRPHLDLRLRQAELRLGLDERDQKG